MGCVCVCVGRGGGGPTPYTNCITFQGEGVNIKDQDCSPSTQNVYQS